MTLDEFRKQTRDLCENATPGTWCNWYGALRLFCTLDEYKRLCNNPLEVSLSGGHPYPLPRANNENNVNFIAESRTLLPKYEKIVGVLAEALEYYSEQSIVNNKEEFSLTVFGVKKATKALKRVEEIVNE